MHFDLDFGNYQQIEVTGKKYHDKNANGVFDGTDEYLDGWDIVALDDQDLLLIQFSLQSFFETSQERSRPLGSGGNEITVGEVFREVEVIPGNRAVEFSERYICFRLVNLVGRVYDVASRHFRKLQVGFTQGYAMVMVLGAATLLALFFIL